MKLINGWHTWHKWWSTRLKVAGLLLIAAPDSILIAWNSLPHDIKSTIPTNWITWLGIGLVAASSIAQIIRQPKVHAIAESERMSDSYNSLG